ncbi:MAG: Ig-like domain-containing protein, partial [Methanosarcinales archaeon]|nr:Ig-like domain-containing protein [Methanosarcinales archaeon]
MEAEHTWEFTTATSDITPPTVIENEPTGTDVPVSTQIHVTFSEAMDQASAESAFSTSPVTFGSFGWNGNIMTYTPDSDLTFDIEYTVTIGTDAKDLADNNMEAKHTWDFTTEATSNNIIQNPGFESGTSPWRFYSSGTGTFSVAPPGFEGDNAAKLALYSDGANIQLYQMGVTLEPNTRYRFSFAGYSTTGHDVNVRLIKHVSPYTSYGLNFAANLGTNWQTFSTEFTTTGFTGTVNDGRLQFWLAPFAEAGDTYYIDNVRLEKVDIQDTTPPTVTGNEPTGTDVPVSTQIHVTFSEAMDQASAESAFSTSPVTFGSFGWNGNIMTYTPNSDLTPDTTYMVTIGTDAKDLADNNMEAEHTWEFTTATPDITPPTVIENEPTGTDVPVSTQIHVTFSEAMDQASAESAFSTSPVTFGSFGWNGNIMTYTPNSDLTPDTTYMVTIGTDAKDLADNNMEAEHTWEFTTATSDITPPTVIENEPTGTDVPVSTQIHVTFSEAMDQASAESAFSTSPVTFGSFGWNGNIMTYTPNSDLTPD